MEGALISLAVSIVLSVFGALGWLTTLCFKLIEVLKVLSKAIKEKSQSEDCDKTEE